MARVLVLILLCLTDMSIVEKTSAKNLKSKQYFVNSIVARTMATGQSMAMVCPGILDPREGYLACSRGGKVGSSTENLVLEPPILLLKVNFQLMEIKIPQLTLWT